ncbi:hypothetical protein GH714_025943 [Hevea brasiliensis]|uniref:Uncharacterized protein n=1 Tax=Hevea brasiliensis TaxID=3981 RepID=A0A6A6KVW6_HEVBR|nr:hypothetical protein GH714_025943 [Hevea brasiliensis]
MLAYDSHLELEKVVGMNESFQVFCNYSFTPQKPFLTSINMELRGVSLTGQVKVSNPVIYSNCRAPLIEQGSPSSASNRGVNATGCYTIPPYVQYFEANMTYPISNRDDRGGSKSAFMVKQDWVASLPNPRIEYPSLMDHVPAVLDWAAVGNS